MKKNITADTEVISSTQLLEDCLNSDLKIYTRSELIKKGIFLSKDEVCENIIDPILQESNNFIIRRIKDIYIRWSKNRCNYYMDEKEKGIINHEHKDKTEIAELVVEVLQDRYIRYGPVNHMPRKWLKDRILPIIINNEPIIFTLAGFPSKVGECPLKVSGKKVDLAEIASLEKLGNITRIIKSYYKPGAVIYIASDGTKFQKSVNTTSVSINQYMDEINMWIDFLKLKNMIEIIDMKKVIELKSAPEILQKRREIFKKYYKIYSKIKNVLDCDDMKKSIGEAQLLDPEGLAGGGFGQFVNVYKTLLNTVNHTSLKNYCSQNKLDFPFIYRSLMLDNIEIQRKDGFEPLRKQMIKAAWDGAVEYMSELMLERALPDTLSEIFPDSIRLTIHPQDTGRESDKKRGVLLNDGQTRVRPWHGVACFRKSKGKTQKIVIRLFHELNLHSLEAIPVFVNGNHDIQFDYSKQPMFYLENGLKVEDIKKYFSKSK